MILPRRAVVLLACLLLAATAAGQPPPAPFADDERAVRIVERYKAMLAANPTEGMALDRLWKSYEEHNATGVLIEDYRRAAEQPDRPAAVLVYGHLLKRAGRVDEAAKAFARAAELDPGGPLPLVAQAELAVARTHPAEAAGLFAKALAKLPAGDRRRLDLLTRLGDAWLAAGEGSKAVAAWEELVTADPNNLALRKQLAANEEKNGFPERAVAQYEYLDAHADPAGRAAALRELGRLHEVRGEFDAARDAFERGLALTARDNWVYGDLQTRLIRLHQRAGRVSELAARWESALAQAPRDLGGYTRLMALAEAEGDPDTARKWLEKLVALAPRDRDSTLRLARLLADAGENERASALYDTLLRVQPGNLDLILARADLELRAGQVDAATRRIEARVVQNPADESVSVPALQFFLSHHLDDAAERWLRAAASRQPAATEPALALAKFYLARRRGAEARGVLETLTRLPGDPAARAGRWTAAADCYKEANEPDEALRCWQEAVALQPDASAPLLAVGESLLVKGDTEGADAAMERALAAAPEGRAREEIDHRLFVVLSERSEPPEPAPEIVHGRGRGFSLGPPGRVLVVRPATPARRNADDEPADDPLADYIAALDTAARDHPSAAAYARLARWLQWSHRGREATAAAEALLALAPDSLFARTILADNALAARDRPAAIARLREIAVLDPAQKSAALGRVADLLMEENDFDGALAILDGLAQDAPGSPDALTTLALGQQRADHWFDACATWERAYALPHLTPAQRANLRRPLLAAYEHLGQFPRAAELLQTAIDAQEDLTVRQDLFRELVVFCQSHSLLSWLREAYEKRLARQPLDYFAMTAMAELYKSAGERSEAYRLLGRAYYSAPDPPAALRALVAEAESLGETADAVAHQRRLSALSGQATAENLSKLAALEEDNLDDEEAARTWEQVAAKFTRDTAALGGAADYFVRTARPGRARELLNQIAALDPTDFRRAYQLGRLDARAGDADGARSCFESILAHTQPEKSSDPLLLPAELDLDTDASRFLAAAGKGTASEAELATPGPASDDQDERRVRLEVIGEMSRMLFAKEATANAEARLRWLEQWRQAAAAGARGEPLTAYYHAGQAEAASGLIASWLPAPEDTDETARYEGIFLLTALRMGDYPTLARWTWEDQRLSEGRAPRLVETLRYFLATGGQPGVGMVAGLFPAGVGSRALLWGTATGVFAEKRWYPQAVELGERALALPGRDGAAESFQLAQWQVDLGRIDAARATLAQAVEEGSGVAYDATANNAVFAALRAYYLLLPAAERPAFLDGYLRRAQARGGSPVHSTLAAALLHGLSGDEAAARRDLEKIVRMRLLDASPGSDRLATDQRRWNYVYACGAQMQAWNLDGLAAHLWQVALAEASAFDRQDPEVRTTLAEIRLHQLVAEVVTAADPQEVVERVAEFERETPAPILLASAASALVNAGQYPAAVQLYERLCLNASGEVDYPRSLLLTLDAAGDTAAVERTLTTMLAGSLPPGSAVNRLESVVRLAGLKESSSDPDGAIRLLADARRQFPRATVILRTLAQTLERHGRADDALAILREAGSADRSVLTQEMLASAELRHGNREVAYALARDAKPPDSEAEQVWWFGRRVELFLLCGHATEAVALARAWVRDGRTNGVPDAAAQLAAHGQPPAARELLADAVARARDPLARYQAQAALVSLFCTAADVPADVFLREMHRLERFAQAVPGQGGRYAEDRYTFARARGATDWLEVELRREWRDGAGDIVAGDWLGRLYFDGQRWDAMRGLVAAINARPNLPETLLSALASRLVKAGQSSMALPLSKRLCRRFPQNAGYVTLRAHALWNCGQRDEAARVLDALDLAATFRETADAPAAGLWLEFGERDRARQSLQAALARDPYAVRSAGVQRRLAALDIEDKNLDDAARRIAAVYRDPAQADLGTLVDFLDAAGQLAINPAGDLPGGDLPLVFVRRAQLLAAICVRLQNGGHADDARRLAEAHPELLPAVPALAASLRRTASPPQLPALVRCFREAIRQPEFASTRIEHELARTLVRSAEVASDGATNLLTQAYELAPDDFAVARPLAEAFCRQGQTARAAEVLKPFLTADALPSDREASRQTLGLK